MNKEIIHKGWVDLLVESTESKSWVKLPVKKTWKRKFLILYCLAGTSENPRLGSYDKEENLLTLGEPKKSIILHPQYRINKHYDFKGKYYVLEVNNDKELWCISSAESSEVVDKWATKIQMQSKLSRNISSCIYLVDGAASENMKRIGASLQKCILHLNKWGIILALQRCRSIIAMWPIKTIRNFECGEHSEFSIEAGRRAPMGEGIYSFYTTSGQQDQIFKTLDRFIVHALHKKASISPNGTSNEVTSDMDYNQAYEQLRQSAIGTGANISANHDFLRLLPPVRPSEDVIDPPEYNYIAEKENTCNNSSVKERPPDPPDYNYIVDEEYRGKNIIAGNVLPTVQTAIEVQNDMYFSSSEATTYDKLEHNKNIARAISSNYDNIDERDICGVSPIISTYDKLNKIDTKDANSLYSPINKDKEYSGMEDYRQSSVASDNMLSSKDESMDQSYLNVGSQEKELGRSSLLSQHSIQELAEHFIYQMPSSLPSTNEVDLAGSENKDGKV